MAGFDIPTTSIEATAIFTGVLLGLAFLPYFRTWRTTYSSRSAQLKLVRAESKEVDSVFVELASKLGSLRSLVIVMVSVATVSVDLEVSLTFLAAGNYAAFIGLASWLPIVLTILAVGGFLQIALSRLQNPRVELWKRRRDASFMYTLIFFVAGTWGFFSTLLTVALLGVTYFELSVQSVEGPVWLVLTVLSGLGSAAIFFVSAQARVLIEQETFAAEDPTSKRTVVVALTFSGSGQTTSQIHYGKLLGIGPLCVFRRGDELVQAVKWSSISSIAAADVPEGSDLFAKRDGS